METVTIQVEGSAFRWVLTALPMALNQLPSDKRAGITVRPLSTGFASDLDPSLVIGGLNVLATLLPCLIQLIQRLLADGNKPLTGSRITLTAEVAPTQTLHYNAREKSKTASQDSIIEDPLTFLLEAINDDEDNCFPIAVRRTISQQPWHPVLKPYIEKIAATHTVRTSDVFARPYFYFYKMMNEFFRDMLPPIHIYTKNVGRFIHTGLARLLGDDYVAEAVRLAAVEGLAECLIGRQKYRLCRHNKCPVYETRLCQCYVAFPPDDYSKCKFPELLGWLELDRLLPPNANLNFFR